MHLIRRFLFPSIETPDELRDEILSYVFVLEGTCSLERWITRLTRMDHQQLLWLQKSFQEALVAGMGLDQGELVVPLRKQWRKVNWDREGAGL